VVTYELQRRKETIFSIKLLQIKTLNFMSKKALLYIFLQKLKYEIQSQCITTVLASYKFLLPFNLFFADKRWKFFQISVPFLTFVRTSTSKNYIQKAIGESLNSFVEQNLLHLLRYCSNQIA
jgi:hypothetical protein